jgi:hypothetical protein
LYQKQYPDTKNPPTTTMTADKNPAPETSWH